MDVELIKYQNADDVPRNRNYKFRIGIRHIQLLYMFLICGAMGVLRVSPGVAMLAVTDTSRINDTYIQIKNWDRKTQGVVLYSFFMGYAIMLVPGELFLKRIGGKYTLAVALLLNGGLCVAMPTVINKGNVLAVSGMHLFMGMSQACVSPANRALLDKWLPPHERSLFGRIIFMGLLLGMILALPVIGIISEARLGWELIYYSLAMMAFSIGAICILLTANSPNKHQAVGDTEKEYIAVAKNNMEKIVMENKERKYQNTNGNITSPPIPWCQILKTSQFWKLAFSHVSSNTVFVFCLSDMPLYLQNFYPTLRENTSWMAIFYTMWLLMELLGMIASYIYNHFFRWNEIPFRIVFSFSFIGITCGLPILPYLIPDWNITAMITLMTILASLSVQTHAVMNVKEMRDMDPGTVLMLTSTIASLAGACIPLLTGFIIVDKMNMHRWRYLFFTLMTIVLFCQAAYFILASCSKVSSRNRVKRGYHLTGYDNSSELLEIKSNHKTEHEAEKI
ncbi:putative inorganic phosphate cotransporter isoform X2 [Galleria mellonella]|uniref:Inorganic phosphate cotransporter isoform X2 n=1 Tax=Galleria mellonella TaxID=7137 RepID=A0ABM3M864_GALME|nr:putative inorganic phosphate cotransporter isoform X2 [Galleria mellonella]